MPVQLTYVHKNEDGVLVKETEEIKDEALEEIASKKLRKLVLTIKSKKTVNPKDGRKADAQIDKIEKRRMDRKFLYSDSIGGLVYLISYDPGKAFFIYKESPGDEIYSVRNYSVCSQEPHPMHD